MKVRQRNKETRTEKQIIQAQREQEDRERAHRNKLNRVNQDAAIKYNKDVQAANNAREADRLKQERQ